MSLWAGVLCWSENDSVKKEDGFVVDLPYRRFWTDCIYELSWQLVWRPLWHKLSKVLFYFSVSSL